MIRATYCITDSSDIGQFLTLKKSRETRLLNIIFQLNREGTTWADTQRWGGNGVWTSGLSGKSQVAVGFLCNSGMFPREANFFSREVCTALREIRC